MISNCEPDSGGRGYPEVDQQNWIPARMLIEDKATRITTTGLTELLQDYVS